jgi:hypothetical protein
MSKYNPTHPFILYLVTIAFGLFAIIVIPPSIKLLFKIALVLMENVYSTFVITSLIFVMYLIYPMFKNK